MRFDLDRMSMPRKIVLTAAGLLYALAVLGNARHGIPIITGVTLFFAVVTFIAFLWVK
jgi:hypothetical protein